MRAARLTQGESRPAFFIFFPDRVRGGQRPAGGTLQAAVLPADPPCCGATPIEPYREFDHIEPQTSRPYREMRP
jgi:hypothetical protein